MRVKLEVNITPVLARLDRYAEITFKKQKLDPAVMTAGFFVQRAAQSKCPVDTGILRASAITVPKHTKYLSRAEVRFANVWYAIIVHQNIHGNIPGGEHPVGEPFFLWNALYQNVDRIFKIIVDKTRY